MDRRYPVLLWNGDRTCTIGTIKSYLRFSSPQPRAFIKANTAGILPVEWTQLSRVTNSLERRPRRILVLSASYGGGHNRVACAIHEAICQRDPVCDVRVIDFVDFVSTRLNYVTQALYTQSIKRWPAGYRLFYKITGDIRADSLFQRWMNSLGRERILQEVQSYRPSTIICTFPTQAGVLSELRADGLIDTPLFTVVTDHVVHGQWIHPHVDHYFVGSSMVALGMCAKGISPDRISVTGIPIRPAFQHRPTCTEARCRLALDPDLPLLLVMASESAMLGNTGQMVNQLTQLDLPHQTVVVCGRNEAFRQRLKAATAMCIRPVRVLGYVDNIPELMSAADLLVTKAGGITTSEALACGLPMVIYGMIPGQEEANGAYLQSHNAAVIASTPDHLLSLARRLLVNDAERSTMQDAAFHLGRPNAAFNVAEWVLSIFSPSLVP